VESKVLLNSIGCGGSPLLANLFDHTVQRAVAVSQRVINARTFLQRSFIHWSPPHEFTSPVTALPAQDKNLQHDVRDLLKQAGSGCVSG
jgi:hypothetical protein